MNSLIGLFGVSGLGKPNPDFFVLDIGLAFMILILLDRVGMLIEAHKALRRPTPSYLFWIRGLLISLLVLSLITIFILILWI